MCIRDRVEKVEVLYAAPPQYHIRGAAINVVLRRRFGRSFSGQVNGTYEGGYYYSCLLYTSSGSRY